MVFLCFPVKNGGFPIEHGLDISCCYQNRCYETREPGGPCLATKPAAAAVEAGGDHCDRPW